LSLFPIERVGPNVIDLDKEKAYLGKGGICDPKIHIVWVKQVGTRDNVGSVLMMNWINRSEAEALDR
jgi:hypothetical protein